MRTGWLPALGVMALVCAGVDGGQTTFREKEGVVSMEAEHADARGKWKEEDPVDGSSGRYMTATSRRSRSDALEFRISVTSVGWFRVWLRCRSTSDADNDCFVMLDGESGSVPIGNEWKKVAGIKTNHTTWGWDSQAKEEGMPLSERLKGCHVLVSSPGAHVLKLGSRSKDFKIDKAVMLHLSHPDAAQHPKDAGPPETRTFPQFPEEARSVALRSIRNGIAQGRLGKGLGSLEELLNSADGEEKEQAGQTLEAVNAWISGKRQTIAAMRKEGRAVAAYMEADLLSRALTGCEAQKEFKVLRSEIRSSREFAVGSRFYRLTHSLSKAKKEQRNVALAQFASRYPDTYYAGLARELTDQ